MIARWDIFENTIILFVRPSKFCISVVSTSSPGRFSLALGGTGSALGTRLALFLFSLRNNAYARFGETNKEY